MEQITSRERMIVAIGNGQPDRVPVAPDMSNMIPARLNWQAVLGRLLLRRPAVWQAYIEAVKHFGIDGWFTYGDMQYQWPGERRDAIEDIRKSADRWVVRRGRAWTTAAMPRETTY